MEMMWVGRKIDKRKKDFRRGRMAVAGPKPKQGTSNIDAFRFGVLGAEVPEMLEGGIATI